MDLDLIGWALIGLPIAFALGWLASSLEARQFRHERRDGGRPAYFRGLNFLLNEQQDEAIDAFIEGIQSDPDTAELHFALGKLFRRRGEYARAVRVHEHLLSRADLSADDRLKAQHALAQDFIHAGLIDRAEEALRKLENTALRDEAALERLNLCELSRNWVGAMAIAQAITSHHSTPLTNKMAHYLCEQAQASHDWETAHSLLLKAQALAPSSPRAWIDLGRRALAANQYETAYQSFSQTAKTHRSALPLFALDLAQAAKAAQQVKAASTLLAAYYETYPSLDVLDAIIELDPDHTPSHLQHYYLHHLERTTSLKVAERVLTDEISDAMRTVLQKTITHASRITNRYRCAACGFETQQHFWQCPGCRNWDSYPPRRIEES